MTDVSDSSDGIRDSVSATKFRTSLLGGFLPHILLGLAAVLPQFHPENTSLGDLLALHILPILCFFMLLPICISTCADSCCIADLHLQIKALHHLLGGYDNID